MLPGAQLWVHEPDVPGESTLSTAAIAAPILAEGEDSSGFHAPGIEEFFPAALFGSTDLGSFWGFDRIMLVRFIVVAILLLLLWLATRKSSLVPSRGQSIVELGVQFVRVQIGEQILGKERARPYLGMLTVIFFTVLAMNLAGVVPFLNIAGTSRVGLPLVLALWVFFVYLAAGVRKHGIGKYLKSQLFPPGIPWPAYILITPIEALQVFVLRPATLTIRLLANMMAGHLMLVLCFAATNFLLLEGGGLIKITGLLAFAGGIFITLFEVFVALLQAYIFTLLSAIYVNFALEEEH
ncbi:F0F1 ATP synthase subunit A [Ruania halotolerans]|uniref:F0F1 ATP synthase subunit A n=1 Tax=Ruania halotolerans TaxID=2897773 RepID=UPI001E39608E|nr:F0F1 ATP synthase subunit A [Ruania halotolerans]UFU07651.1 F0F1 ATP synthase subunit A [Ruania halotolerans]